MILRRRPVRSRSRRVAIKPRRIRFDELKAEAEELSNIVHFLREDLERKDSVLMPLATTVQSEEVH